MKSTPSRQPHTCILKVLVGSHAHGLAGPDSDKDFRSVLAIPTTDMFRVGFKYQGMRMVKEEDDETAWEIAHFLFLALQGHPLVLETFLAPVVETDDWGTELRALFPRLWSPRSAYDSFMNYCENQRKKMLEKKDGRPAKYAAAYVRVLFNLCELLERGTFTVRIADTTIGDRLGKIKAGEYRPGEVIDLGEQWAETAAGLLTRCSQQSRPDQADEFLIRLRTSFLR